MKNLIKGGIGISSSITTNVGHDMSYDSSLGTIPHFTPDIGQGIREDIRLNFSTNLKGVRL